jgi:arabinofuranosyltransferase
MASHAVSPEHQSVTNLRIRARWTALVAIMMVVCLAIGARLLPGMRTIDDAYITYRYAGNILAGNGFVFNPGERVLGTTTPLYTFLLVILGFFTGGAGAPFPAISLAINAIADALTCLLLFNLGRRLGSIWAGLATAIVWAIAPYSVTFAVGGLETSLYVLLLTATVYAHIRKQHNQAAIYGALALLTRPDALILLGPLALDRLLHSSRWRMKAPWISGRTSGKNHPITWSEAGLFLIPVAVWVLFSSLYFGSPLPHSITAKTLAYRLGPAAGFIRLLQHYATPFMGYQIFGTWWIGAGMVLYPFLFVVGARRALRQNARIWPFLAYPWLYFAAFSIANPLIFRWYMTPPLPAYFLGILLGLDQVLNGILSKLKSWAGRSSRAGLQFAALAGIILILAPTLMSLQDWTAHPDHGLARPAPEMAWYKLELLYSQAADYLAPEISARANPPTLAAGDVGALGYYTSARILDTVGLNSPITTRYYPLDPKYYIINYAIPADLIIDQKPDYVVILEVYGRLSLLEDARFHQSYVLRRKLPTDIYGSDGMLIFEKRAS